MSRITLAPNASGSGTLTVAAPNTNTDYTLTLPSATGTINTSGLANEVPAGSAGSPSIYPTGDSNTGIFFPAADTIAFAEGGAEAMRIDTSGNVLVGTTSIIGSGKLSVNYASGSGRGIGIKTDTTSTTGQIWFENPNGNVGQITTSGSATAYATSSDYRLKENVQPMTGALDTIAQLNPVTYNWRVDGSDGQGFIAHELQAVVPDCVTGEKDAVDDEGNPKYQGVDTSFLVATLVKAVQEQQQMIQALQADIAALKGV